MLFIANPQNKLLSRAEYPIQNIADLSKVIKIKPFKTNENFQSGDLINLKYNK